MALRLLLGDAQAPGVPLDAEALEELYRPPRSEWLRANFVVSLDGAVEIDGRSGALGGADDKVVFATLRALADVVLVGAGTACAEHYGPARVDAAAMERRAARGQLPRPRVAVLTNRAAIDPAARLFCDGADDVIAVRPLVLTCKAAPAKARARLAERAEVVVCGDDAVDLQVAMGELRARGLGGVLCEGGPTVVTQLLQGGLLDELCLTHAPIIAGPDHTRLVVGGPWTASVTTALVQLVAGEGLLFGRYRFGSR